MTDTCAVAKLSIAWGIFSLEAFFLHFFSFYILIVFVTSYLSKKKKFVFVTSYEDFVT